MKKGYSVVVTSTDSGKTKYFFLSKTFCRIAVLVASVIIVVIIIGAINYSKVYYQALETVILKRRNLEIEKEFAKLNELQENMRIIEKNNRKLKVLLGAEKTPDEVEPIINEVSPNYTKEFEELTNTVNENIPYLLPTRGRLSRNYSPEHTGVDIAAPQFSPVVAAAAGVVKAVAWDSIYGNYVVLEHSIHYSTFYGHLHSIAAMDNDKVASGEIIGTIGSTGRSTSPHLHYEVRFEGQCVDPMGYLPFVFSLKEQK